MTLLVLSLACESEAPGPVAEEDDAVIADDSASVPSDPASTPVATGDTATLPPVEPLRLNEVRAKSSHNSYERYEALFDQLVYHRIRSIELDIHVDKGSAWPAVAGDWYVYHASSGDPTTCHRLSDCLVEIGAFHDAVPEHELVTVFVDLKSGFDADGHGAVDLDARIRARFGDEALLTPAFLMDACPGAADLRDAVAGACPWPAVEDLRGRIAFVLTGGSSCDADTPLSAYFDGGATAIDRVGFVAPTPDGGCPLDTLVDLHRELVFVNLAPYDVGDAGLPADAGMLVRVWGLESSDAWEDGAAAHFLGTNQVNLAEDSWATTAGPGGWPFTCIAGCDVPDAEVDDVFGFEVTSGDQWGEADEMALISEDLGAASTDWEAFVSVESSHVESFAKGCLVARAGADAGSASFAMCRPADEHPIRAQIRATDGASTTEVEVAIHPPDTVDDASAAFLRLIVAPDGGGARATGYASQDGVTWVFVAQETYDVPLPVQGLSVSGHDSGDPVRFLFGNLVRTVDGVTGPLGLADLPSVVLLGGATVTSFDGPVP